MMTAPMPAAAVSASGPVVAAAAPASPRAGRPAAATRFEESLDARLGESRPAAASAPRRHSRDPLAPGEWRPTDAATTRSTDASTAATTDAARQADDDEAAVETEGNSWLAMNAAALVALPVVVPAQDAQNMAGRTPDGFSLAEAAPASAAPAEDAADAAPAPAALAEVVEQDHAADLEAPAAPSAADALAAMKHAAAPDAGASAADTQAADKQTAPEEQLEHAVKADAGAVRMPVRPDHQPAVETVATVETGSATQAAASQQADADESSMRAKPEFRQAGPQQAALDSSRFHVSSSQAFDGGAGEHGFEQDGRRSFAGQRFAAAFSMQQAPATADAASTAAPAISVPLAAPPVTAGIAVTSAVATTATASMPAAAPDVDNVASLVEAMRMTAKAGGWEATVRLKPDHFGEVTIQLKVDGKSVSASVNAESSSVRQWLLSQEDAVRSGLAEHGLQLDRFQVSRDGQRRDAEEQPQQQYTPNRRARQRESFEAEPRFEVVV